MARRVISSKSLATNATVLNGDRTDRDWVYHWDHHSIRDGPGISNESKNKLRVTLYRSGTLN